MRAFLTFLLFIAANQAFGQTGKLFKGNINKTIKVSLYLQGLDIGTNADRIVGSYKYDHQTAYILLNGYRNNDGNIVLVEQATANFSGVFLGTRNQKSIKGKWISADRSTTYSFELVEVNATAKQLAAFQNAMEDIADKFSGY